MKYNIMKIKTLLITVLLFGLFGLRAQTIEEAFVNLPNQYFPLLDKDARAELMARYNVSNTDSIVNNFGGVSKISVMDKENEYLKLNLTEKSSFEVKMWTINDSTKVIGFSHTVCAPVCDSHIAFFNTQYKRLDTGIQPDIFPEIGISDFLNKEKIVADGKTTEEIIEKYDILFGTISFMQNEDNVLLKSNTKEYLPSEIYTEIEPYLSGDKIEYKWVNGKFEKGEVSW